MRTSQKRYLAYMHAEPNFPLISVVMTTYNGKKFIGRQLDSIINQTYPNIEIIILDDGSTDGTVDLLKQYADNSSGNIKVVINEKNLGYVKNFEKGMLLAKGSLIALSDQDDIWVPHKLETLREHIGEHLIVYSDSDLIDADDNRLFKKMSDIRNQIGYDNCLMYTIGAWAPAHAMLIKKELTEKCIPFPALVTHDFWLGFVAACYKPIAYVNESLVLYRQHAANAIGANTHSGKTIKPSRSAQLKRSRERMKLLYEKCPADNKGPKQVLKAIHESYQSFSLHNNWKRMTIFFKHSNVILAYKKKSPLMKILFCIKMFFKID